MLCVFHHADGYFINYCFFVLGGRFCLLIPARTDNNGATRSKAPLFFICELFFQFVPPAASLISQKKLPRQPLISVRHLQITEYKIYYCHQTGAICLAPTMAFVLFAACKKLDFQSLPPPYLQLESTEDSFADKPTPWRGEVCIRRHCLQTKEYGI